MSSRRALLALCFLAYTMPAFSQDKAPVKFGNVSEKDFAVKVYPVDSNAQAVVIADIGYSSIEGNTKGFFSLVFKHYKRVHILNKNAFDLADVSIPLWTNGDDEETLEKLKAVTYNLENGKVVEYKLDTKSGVFKDKINKNLLVKKFTFPNVKEGSIIEYEYTVNSDYLRNLQPWEYQGSYPRLWSEYNVSLPEFLQYAFLTKGYKAYDINDRKTRSENFTILDSRGAGATERFSFTANVTDNRWVIKNVPALKEENFTSSLHNHLTRIEFQLSAFRQPLTYRNFTESWSKVAGDLLKSVSFGEKLSTNNGWLDEYTEPLVSNAKNDLEKARRIYYYVRDNYTCTDYTDLYAEQTLKNIVKTKKGTVAELNLLLTAMLKHENITADPVILSTRSNGVTYEMYPLLTQYNYVIARAIVDGNPFYLDASESRMAFGHLPVRCYNGHARVISNEAPPLYFVSDTLMERKNTTVFVVNDDKGKIVGSLIRQAGSIESFNLRESFKEKGKENMAKDIAKTFMQEVLISNLGIDSLEKYEDNVTLHYDFDFTEENEDVIYFNPLIAGEAMKENPFKSAERQYPVEMPYVFDQTYTMQMDVPAGYVVDELPKSMVIKLNEAGEGMFEYRISASGSNISFRCRLQMLRANFEPDEYEMLREFFNMIVAKEAEQIVLKKKK